MLDACLSSEIATYLQPRNEALVALQYDTGIRRAEAAALDVKHLALDSGTLYLLSEIQKGAGPGSAMFELSKWGADSTRALKRYLRDRWKGTPAQFPSRSSDRMTPRSIGRAVKRVATVAGVKP
jgi:integrase